MSAITNPTCGKCGLAMTPQNSRIHPEYFLHDACLPVELKPKVDAPDVTAWKYEIKVEDWHKSPDQAVSCGVDLDGDVGIIDCKGYSIILTRRGAEDLANWINGLET